MSDDAAPGAPAAHWARLVALFDGALALPTAERRAWLERECADDAALRAEVSRMLDASARPGMLDRPPAHAAPAEDVRTRLAAALADRYTIERELGRGGMAIVYLAVERKHARRVVLKVLQPAVAASLGPQRFVREVRIAARLNHPNIVHLIDSGDADGLLYYVMPWVEGEAVRDRVARGALDAAQASAILRDVAAALAHAHAAGVVHRDLKPDNVLLADGHALLLDFGVAKLAAATDAEHATRQGFVVGTPAYMAPEQRVGAPGVNARADVYAWGVLAHELLVGDLPQRGLDGLVDVDAASDALRAAAVPAPLATLVTACLAASPDHRPPDGRALVSALDADGRIASTGGGMATTDARRPRRRVALVAAAAMVAVAAATTLVVAARRDADPAVAAASLARGGDAADAAARGGIAAPVAVAALANETGDDALDAWGRMAADWITQGLQEHGAVAVVPWPTVRGALEARDAASTADVVAALADEIGARTVVSGAYYLAGDSLHFNVEITDAEARRLVGAPPAVVVPRDSAHVAVRLLRDRLMAAVAIWSDERLASIPDLARRPPTFDAYQAFDGALHEFTAQRYGAAAVGFRRAHALDTTFIVPLLYATTAYWNTEDYAAADSMSSAVQARRATLSGYHRGWSDFLAALLAGDGSRALAAIRETAREAPHARAWYALAQAALELDRPREALDALDRLDPDRGDMRGWSSYWTQRTHALHLLGAHEAELDAARAMQARHPDRRVAGVLAARALGALGREAEIDSLLAALAPLPPTTYWSQGAAMVTAGEELAAHGDVAAGRRRFEQGVAWLRAQLAVRPDERVHRYWLGTALYHLERWAEADRVFGALARDYPDRLQYRGMAALAAARAGAPDAELLLGAARPHERGTHAAFRARLAAVRGDPTRAATLLSDATRDGIDGLPWLHGIARLDLAPLVRAGIALPTSLRFATSGTRALR